MPWRAIVPMDEKIRFIETFHGDVFTFTELCALFGITRKTGYKWLERWKADGRPGLEDRSHAPHSCPHRMRKDVAAELLAIRRRHPSWGPAKLLRIVRRRRPSLPLPARSTTAALFKRHNLVKPRRRRPHPGHPGLGQTPMSHPNAVWTADFKGQFKTLDGKECYPFTLIDGFSRFCLACQGLPAPKHDLVRPLFERAFREYGLPNVIRTDNGAPFASQAIHRLSRLHVWWIKLGVYPELILPGHPQQNGRHERFHKTLKADTARPAASSLRTQQRAFDRFRQEFNYDRPHEALGQEMPASLYQPSFRPYPHKIPELVYPPHFERRLVSRNGGIRWGCGWVNVSQVLSEEYVGIEEVDDGVWSVYFGPLLLGRFAERDLELHGGYPYNKPL
ncbi:MAG: integrase core domain-containing protein [Anaerolineales bacterium]